MEQARERQNQDADTILTMELENLDRLQLAAMPGALKGNHLLIDRVLKIQEPPRQAARPRRPRQDRADQPGRAAPVPPGGRDGARGAPRADPRAAKRTRL
jgi:hypothetical protein